METKLIDIKSGGRYTLYIGRANSHYNLNESKWANKYVIGKDGTRSECIEKYKQDLLKNDKLMDDLHEIDNHVLGCWCFPENSCHGEVLIDLRKKQKDFELQTGGIEHVNKPIKKYKLAVVGSRTITDRKLIFDYLDSKYDKIDIIISGGAKGVDSIAQDWAKERGFPCLVYYPKWYNQEGEYDKSAGFKRNYLIVKDCDVVVAFTTGSAGTQNSIDLANKLGKKVIIHKVDITKNI